MRLTGAAAHTLAATPSAPQPRVPPATSRCVRVINVPFHVPVDQVAAGVVATLTQAGGGAQRPAEAGDPHCGLIADTIDLASRRVRLA